MDRYYSYDPEEGFDEHATSEAAECAACRALGGFRGDADEDGWPSGVADIHWGRLLPLGMSAGTEGTDEYGEPWIDYHLSTQPDELAHLRTERDTLRDRVNDEHNALALIDKLHADLAEVTRERDEALARVAELEAHELEVSRLTGIVYEADYHCHAGPRDQVLAEIERLKGEARDAYELRQRVAELEAPPVVPEGWAVRQRVARTWPEKELGPWECLWVGPHPEPRPTATALRALAWAIEHDTRPPHAGDEVTP